MTSPISGRASQALHPCALASAPTVNREREVRDRDAGERETHITVLRRQLLQEDPKPRPVGGPAGVQAREPQAQNFRTLRRCSRRRVVKFAFLFFPPSSLTPLLQSGMTPSTPSFKIKTRTADPLLHLWSN